MSIKASDILCKSNAPSIAEILASGDDAAFDALLIDRADDFEAWMQAELRTLALLRAHGVDMSGTWQHSLDEWRSFLDRLRELEHEYGVWLVVLPAPPTKGRPLEWTEEDVQMMHAEWQASGLSLRKFAARKGRKPSQLSRLFAKYELPTGVDKNAGNFGNSEYE